MKKKKKKNRACDY